MAMIFLITIILLYSTSDAFSTTRGIVQSSGIRNASSSRLFVFDVPSSTLDQRFDVEQSSRSAGTQQIIDNILDECTRYSARRPIMVQFDPEAKSIWRHWRGTVIAETWKSAAWHALWAVAVYVVLQKYPFITKWFKGFNTVWGEPLAVTTFTLTFFVNEAYACWRKCLDICYNVQGRLNDLGMALAGCARRIEPQDDMDPSSLGTTSTFTEPSRKLLLIIARYIRVFNILMYASFTRSHRPLLTPQGMRRMVKRGLLTEKEHSLLTNSQVPVTVRHNVVLMWIFRTAIDSRKAGHFDGGFGFEQNLLLRIEEIRAEGNYMECILRARLPFSYVHIVQVLVDLVTWLYPIMAITSNLSFQIGVLGVIFLTMTYQGLFDLAKRFLDPFHNESFWSGFDPIRVDTIIAETNAGSLRWMYGLDKSPIPLTIMQGNNRIKGGDKLDPFVLPDEGISAEEVSEMDQVIEEAERDSTEVDFHEQVVGPSTRVVISDDDTVEAEQQTYQDEFEETQAIMSAPPGADFVPGLDDQDDEDCFLGQDDEEDEDCVPLDDTLEPPTNVYDDYLETLTTEYEDTMKQYEISAFIDNLDEKTS